MNLKCLFCGILVGLYVEAIEAVNYTPEKISASISLKVPGNESEKYSLDMRQLKNDPFILSVGTFKRYSDGNNSENGGYEW